MEAFICEDSKKLVNSSLHDNLQPVFCLLVSLVPRTMPGIQGMLHIFWVNES